jgi:predicted CoA-binding protein
MTADRPWHPIATAPRDQKIERVKRQIDVIVAFMDGAMTSAQAEKAYTECGGSLAWWREFIAQRETGSQDDEIGCDYCRDRTIDHCPKCDAEWS